MGKTVIHWLYQANTAPNKGNQMNKNEIHEAALEEARLRVWFKEWDRMSHETRNLSENLKIYGINSTKYAKAARIVEVAIFNGDY